MNEAAVDVQSYRLGKRVNTGGTILKPDRFYKTKKNLVGTFGFPLLVSQLKPAYLLPCL